MPDAGAGSRIIGLTFAIPGAWVCFIALFLVYKGAQDVWGYGFGSNSILIGPWYLTVTQYFLLCCVVFVVGVALLGVGIQYFFRTPRDE